MKKFTIALAAFLTAIAAPQTAPAAVSVSGVKVQPRAPQYELVDIDYTINATGEDAAEGKEFHIALMLRDASSNRPILPRTFTGDGASGETVKKGARRITWNRKADSAQTEADSAQTPAFSVTISAYLYTPYMVIDLAEGAAAATFPVSCSATGPDLSNDECRTTKLWLKLIPAGTFMMGSPEDELGRSEDETQHKVTLTKPYYMGVFQVTQKQWELVTGSNPAHNRGDARPAEYISYSMVRGSPPDADWPREKTIEADSFVAKLRIKTGITLDLPTEAQWEYACRAGTTTALNSGKNLTSPEHCANMDKVGRYRHNRDKGENDFTQHTKVGSYSPNAWGLYDMHGNGWEWCLDNYTPYTADAQTDPPGGYHETTILPRVLRGGSWFVDADQCRSARRLLRSHPLDFNYGLRLVALPTIR